LIRGDYIATLEIEAQEIREKNNLVHQ